MNTPTQLRIACLTLALASCLAIRADASFQVDIDLDDGKDDWALALASELSSDVASTSSSSSSSSGPEERPEPQVEIRAKLSHSNLPASSTSGSGNVGPDGGGAEAPAVGSVVSSTAGQTLTRRVYDRGQWIPDEPIFFLLKVPRLHNS